MKKLLLLILLSISGFNYSNATHIVGSDITYKRTGINNVYEVTLKLYRDCQGIQLCTNCPTKLSSTCSAEINIIGASGNFTGTSFGKQLILVDTLQSAFDVVQICDLQRTVCTNCGTRTPGSFTPGIEVYTYKGLINLSQVPVACCKVLIAYGPLCCRNSAVTTLVGPSSLSYWNEALINRCVPVANSSPQYENRPLIVACAGVDVHYNLSASDPDGDSLSYSLGPTYTNYNSPAPYASPYSSSVPFPYLGAPGQSPPLLPPSGINLNNTNGDLRFRPIGNFVSNLVIEVREFRKFNLIDSLVGITRRDVQIYSTMCPSGNYDASVKVYQNNNLLPDSVKTFNTNVGSTLCLTFVATKSGNTTDTTDIGLINSNDLNNAAATFTKLLNNTNRPVNDSAKLCFTPTANMARKAPYAFTVISGDRACPIPSKSFKGYLFKVNSIIENHPISVTKCEGDSASFEVTLSSGTTGTITYQWKKNGVNIQNATSSKLNLYNISFADTANYSVEVMVNNITEPSTVAYLNLWAKPSVSFSHLPAECVNIPVSFTNTSTQPQSGQIVRTVWGFDDSTYQETPNATKTYTTPGIYMLGLLAINNFGCYDTATSAMLINGVNKTVAVSGNVLTIAEPNASYQWFICDSNNTLLPNDTLQSFTATNSGTYRAVVSKNGCTDTTDCINVSATTINKIRKNLTTIYPNPTSSDVVINFNLPTTGTVILYGVDGKQLLKQEIQNKTSLPIKIEGQKGVYMINVNSTFGNFNYKIVKE